MNNSRTFRSINFVKSDIFLKTFRFIFILFALFLFTFHGDIGLGQLTTERLGVVLLGVYWLIFGDKRIFVSRQINTFAVQRFYLLVFLILAYSLILTFFVWPPVSNSSFAFTDFLNSLILGFLTCFFLIGIFKDVDEFLNVIFAVCLIQSIIVISKIIFPSFGEIVDNSININQYFDYTKMRSAGYYGGIFCLTSTGSMALSCGIVASVRRLLTNKHVFINSLCFLVICASCAIVSRTGITISILALLFLFFYREKNYSLFSSKLNKLSVLSSIMLLALIVAFALTIFETQTHISTVFSRLLQTTEYGLDETFFNAYFQTRESDAGIPPISFETLIGTGITSGVSSFGTIIDVDGGFFRMYCSIGIIASILVYFSFLLLIIKCFRSVNLKVHKFILFLFILFLFIGEFKEPFLFLNRYMIVYILVFVSLCSNGTFYGKS